MTDLIKRLKEAPGPSRELDAEIAVALAGTVSLPDDLITHRTPYHFEDEPPGTYWKLQRSGRSPHTAPEYTADRTLLDAAIEKLQAMEGQDG